MSETAPAATTDSNGLAAASKSRAKRSAYFKITKIKPYLYKRKNYNN